MSITKYKNLKFFNLKINIVYIDIVENALKMFYYLTMKFYE